MNLFYQHNASSKNSEIIFDKEESRHIHKVLRKQEGDVLYITNGEGYLFNTQIISSSPKKCISKVIKSQLQDPLPYQLHIAIAPTKLNDRFEWFLEKATEIGVSEITPIICDHSERKVINKERYQKILISAMKQSLSCYLPKLNDIVSYSKFIALPHSENFIGIAHCEANIKKEKFKTSMQPNTSSLVLIGPEGDFSLQEIEQAQAANFTQISLGDRRLRTETAAIVTCNMLAVHNDR